MTNEELNESETTKPRDEQLPTGAADRDPADRDPKAGVSDSVAEENRDSDNRDSDNRDSDNRDSDNRDNDNRVAEDRDNDDRDEEDRDEDNSDDDFDEPQTEASRQADSDLERRILELVQSEDYQPLKPKVITKKLGLKSDDRKAVRRAIKQLHKRKLLHYAANHVVRPGEAAEAAKAKNTVLGVFRRVSSGKGFVRPRGAPAHSRDKDIMIPVNKTSDASQGDVVRVRLGKVDAQGRQRGEVLEVVERDTHQFVGVYFEQDDIAYVRIDGKTFQDPIPVGDPGAKNAAGGDKVVVEMVRFPSHHREGEAVLTEVLGPKGAIGIDTLSIIREYELPDAFPEEVLEDARRQADRFDESLGGRRDLTAETIITIDPEDARDFDDAISLRRLDNGNWLLGVHIADVSHFVPEGSQLDQEARQRGTSVYLPDRVLPMLPEVISNNLASLQPDRLRYAKTALIEMSPEGARLHSEFCSSAIRSCRRFTYEEVDAFLEDREAWKSKLTPAVHQLLADMHELAMVVRARRLKRGSIELSMPELRIDLDKQGLVTGAHVVPNTESHQMIEEFMLEANQSVAEWLNDRELPFLRRIHPLPAPQKLRQLTQFVRSLDIECESLESRYEIKRVVAAVADLPIARAVHFAVLRSMQKAVYSPEPLSHYALNFDQYCHFTSPIRRYPDLLVHRLLESALAGKKGHSPDHLEVLGEHCSSREQRAEAAERELTKVKLLQYLSDQIGMQFDAVITGVERFGMFAQGIELPAEGILHITSLVDDYYRYDEETRSLIGRKENSQYRLGDTIRVEVAHVDIDRRELDYRIAQKGTAVRPGEKPIWKGPRPARGKGRGRQGGRGPQERGFGKRRHVSGLGVRKKKKKDGS